MPLYIAHGSTTRMTKPDGFCDGKLQEAIDAGVIVIDPDSTTPVIRSIDSLLSDRVVYCPWCGLMLTIRSDAEVL